MGQSPLINPGNPQQCPGERRHSRAWQGQGTAGMTVLDDWMVFMTDSMEQVPVIRETVGEWGCKLLDSQTKLTRVMLEANSRQLEIR